MKKNLLNRMARIEKLIRLKGINKKLIILIPTLEKTYLALENPPKIYSSIDQVEVTQSEFDLTLIVDDFCIAETDFPEEYQQARK
ncbi:hypothetical protein [Enterococcus bulliens]